MTAGPLASLQIVAVRPDRAEEHATAERVLAGPLRPRTELIGVPGRRAESGHADREVWQDERWFLKSRTTRVHRTRTAALAALERLQEDKRALGELAPSRTILIVTAEDGDRIRLWTLAPRLVTLREELDAAGAAGVWDGFARALAGWNAALSVALTWSLGAGLCLDASPANFATQWGRLRYLDEDVAARHDALGIEDAFAERFGEYRAPDPVWDDYAHRFARDLAARTPRALRVRLRLEDRLRAAAAVHRAAAPYLARVLGALEAS